MEVLLPSHLSHPGEEVSVGVAHDHYVEVQTVRRLAVVHQVLEKVQRDRRRHPVVRSEACGRGEEREGNEALPRK